MAEITSTQQQQPIGGQTANPYEEVRLFSPTLPILLRSPHPNDADAVHEITSDPAIYDSNQWLARRASISEADALQKIHKMRGYAAMVPPARIELVVVLLSAVNAQEEGQVIGMSGIRDFHERPGKKIADINASIVSSQRGKGYFAEAIRLSADFAFEQTDANAIQVMVHEDSEKKIDILKEKFGWKRGAVDGQGKYRRYDATKAEWATASEHFSKGGSGGGFGSKLKGLFK